MLASAVTVVSGLATLLVLVLPAAQPGPAAQAFDLQVRAVSQAGERPIGGARVSVEVEGLAPIEAPGDSDGLARLSIPAELAGRPARLIVEAAGHRRLVRNIDLRPGQLPLVVPLTAE